MDKNQLLRRYRRALGAALFIPYIEKAVPEEPASQRAAKVAHWADALPEATPEAAERLYGAFEPGCAYAELCGRARACMHIMRRVGAISSAKNAIALARDGRTD